MRNENEVLEFHEVIESFDLEIGLVLFVHDHDSEGEGDENNDDHENHVVGFVGVGLIDNLVLQVDLELDEELVDLGVVGSEGQESRNIGDFGRYHVDVEHLLVVPDVVDTVHDHCEYLPQIKSYMLEAVAVHDVREVQGQTQTLQVIVEQRVVQSEFSVFLHDSERTVDLISQKVILKHDHVLRSLRHSHHRRLKNVVPAQIADQRCNALIRGQHVRLQVQHLDVRV